VTQNIRNHAWSGWWGDDNDDEPQIKSTADITVPTQGLSMSPTSITQATSPGLEQAPAQAPAPTSAPSYTKTLSSLSVEPFNTAVHDTRTNTVSMVSECVLSNPVPHLDWDTIIPRLRGDGNSVGRPVSSTSCMSTSQVVSNPVKHPDKRSWSGWWVDVDDEACTVVESQ
jgi:hypothetical protein